MHAELIKEYRKLRKAGLCMLVGRDAEISLSNARSNLAFAKLESLGLVRLRYVNDDSMFDASYLETWGLSEKKLKEEQKRLWDLVEREGVWICVGEYRINPESSSWNEADSICGLIGTDEIGYQDDIRASTVSALKDALKSRCKCCRKTK